MILLLFQTIAFLLLLLTLPLTLELALVTFALLFVNRPRPTLADSGIPFRLAVIVPAHNEAAGIANTVQSLLIAREQALAADIRILVIAHNCTDATAEHARAAGAEARILDGPEGKGAALGFAFHTVPAEGYLVIDADSLVDPFLLQRVQSLLAFGTEALQCRYEPLPADTPRTRLGALAFRAINILRPLGRERLHLSAGILGNGFAVRRSLLDHVPYTAWSIIEDLEFHLNLVSAGVRVRYLDDVSVRSAIATTRNQHSRWEGGRLRMAWSMLPSLLLQVLRGRFRMIEPILDLAGLPIAQQTLLLLAGLLLPLHAFRIYCLTALIILALHILCAVFLGDDPRADLFALVRAPGYLLWKLRSLPSIFRTAGKDSAWVRTERAEEPASSTDASTMKPRPRK